MVTIGSLTALSILVFSTWAIAQSSQDDPEALIRRVVQNELGAERQDHSHWMFRLEEQDKNGQIEVDQVVETKDADVKRPILINGHPLTAEQQQQWERQLDRNRGELTRTVKEKNRDAARSQNMLKLLPDAFLYSYGERRGQLVQLNFKPNPRFHPGSHEAQVFHAMEGYVWVDDKQNRLAEISGHLTERVKFDGGLLGHLDKGGTFDVRQQEVAPGYWELTVLNVQMKGKALFFKTISVHQKYARTDFKHVPDDLTIAKAADMLRQQAVSKQVSRR